MIKKLDHDSRDITMNVLTFYNLATDSVLNLKKMNFTWPLCQFAFLMQWNFTYRITIC